MNEYGNLADIEAHDYALAHRHDDADYDTHADDGVSKVAQTYAELEAWRAANGIPSKPELIFSDTPPF